MKLLTQLRALSLACLLIFGATVAANGTAPQPPAWWTDAATAIIDPQGIENNYAPVNLGQLKHVATMARIHLDQELQAIGGAWDDDLVDMIDGFASNPATDFSPVNLGQLKAAAVLFYDRLDSIGYDTRQNLLDRGYPLNWAHPYPWDPQTPPQENYAPVNLGQLKMIFSFDLAGFDTSQVDTIGNGIPDWWEYEYFGYVGIDPEADPDVDGLTNYEEFVLGVDPVAATAFPMMVTSLSSIGSLEAALEYSSWIDSFEGADEVPSDQKKPGDSPSGDTLTNVWKFAFGMKPMTAYPSSKRSWATIVTDPYQTGTDDEYLAIVYHKKIDPGYVPLVRVEAYARSGLTAPMERLECPDTFHIQLQPPDEDWEQVILLDEITIAQSDDMRFMHMSFTLAGSEVETIRGLRHRLSTDFDAENYLILDEGGNVASWHDRGPGEKDLNQQNVDLRPTFIPGVSGVGSLAFDGSGQFLSGDGYLANEMEEIALVFVWEPKSLQNAVLWEQSGNGGQISLKLNSDGAYGLAIDGILTEQAHSYKVNETVVSVIAISRDSATGIATAHLYHNTRTIPGASIQAGAVPFSSEDIVTIGSGSSGGGFHGEIRDVLLYNSCFEPAEAEFLSAEFEFAYNLDLDRTGDLLPIWWQYEHFGTIRIDPSGDQDGDGLTNLDEFRLGLDPLLNEAEQTASRENFGYDSVGRLTSFSPTMAADEYDNEGNLSTVIQ